MQTSNIGPSGFIKPKDDGLNCGECLIDRLHFYPAEEAGSFFEHYAYEISRFPQNQILCWNIFSGELLHLSSIQIEHEIKFYQYLCLSINHGISYYRMNEMSFISITSLDMEHGTFEFIGEPIRKTFRGGVHLHRVSYNLFAVSSYYRDSNEYSTEIRLFEVNRSTASIKYQAVIPASNYTPWLHFIDGKVFLVGKEGGDEYRPIEWIGIFNLKDSSLTKLKNSGLDYYYDWDNRSILHKIMMQKISTNSFHNLNHHWYKSYLFVLDSIHFLVATHFPTQNYLFVFDLNLQKWSEILLKFSWLHRGLLKLNIDDGILILLHHDMNEWDEPYVPSSPRECTNVTTYRVAIEKPEKLKIIVWSKLRKVIPNNKNFSKMMFG